ncbi:MAG: hypothetical protein Fur0025_36360 [Oscillatoriaceae cyanobacterium]
MDKQAYTRGVIHTYNQEHHSSNVSKTQYPSPKGQSKLPKPQMAGDGISDRWVADGSRTDLGHASSGSESDQPADEL